MTTANELTARYNENLIALGRKPIKSGSYSKTQLKKFIAQSDAAVAKANEETPVSVKDLEAEKKAKAEKAKAPRKAREAKAKKAPTDSNNTPLSAIAEELGMTPRAARIKLRNKKSPFTKDSDLGWVFPTEMVKEVKKYLKG